MSSGLCETLRFGMDGENVRMLQQALIDTGYLAGRADGIFGAKTEAAVIAFQRENGLKADGLAGKKTQAALNITIADSSQPGWFSNDYSLIRDTSDPARIRLLQRALIKMNYLKGSEDGSFGTVTRAAVKTFQQCNKLKADGKPGEKTLKAIENALASGHKAVSLLDAEPLPKGAGKMDAPPKSSIELLHWYDDIKPSLKSGAKVLVYEPVSGLAWTLMVHSKGRHCDLEPLTLTDTQIMLKAFGNKNTWSQKGVYVQLPDGRWTVGATHTVPHLTGYIKNNGFDGHLCVHFFRDMDECAEKDPNYGVSNQLTIRALWKKVSGQSVQ